MSKIITVWGSPNSGKTTLSVKLARELSKDNDVILLSTDIVAPPVGILLPYIKEKDRSLGRLLDKVTLTQEDIFNNLLTLKGNKNIAFLGYAQGENYKTYAEYTMDRASELIVNLSLIADYLIIDISSIIQYDSLSKAALKLADEVIRLCGSDLKAISYFKSTFPLMIDKSYNLSTHIKVVSKIEDCEPKSIIMNHYGPCFCDLPYTKELQNQCREGLLLDRLKDKQSANYNSSLDKLISKITGKTIEEKKTMSLKRFKIPKIKLRKEKEEDE